ncbi:hypothetical protein AVEN_58985-1 [Araneus ventricosus]|uniref:Uncharacterized protein n=1 Tax=Araneus ventricosus TaxID=182803 RepID=A0A4Y2S0R6_ARAVE|nr:hypothetical protein AVEN_58985-1 [Araneus ventricosus]
MRFKRFKYIFKITAVIRHQNLRSDAVYLFLVKLVLVLNLSDLDINELCFFSEPVISNHDQMKNTAFGNLSKSPQLNLDGFKVPEAYVYREASAESSLEPKIIFSRIPDSISHEATAASWKLQKKD